MQTLIHYLSLIPVEFWYSLLAGAVIPFVMQLLKKWFGLDSTKVISGFTTALAFLSALLPQIISWTSLNPALLGPETAAVYGVATFLYIHVLKPFNNFSANYKAFKASQAVTAPETTPAVSETIAAETPTTPSTVTETTPPLAQF